MSSESDRRRHTRYRVRLDVKLLRGDTEVAVEVFNLSVGGCLLVTPMRLEPGAMALLDIPRLGLPPVRLHVVRSRHFQSWYVAAARFEPLLPDESLLARLASEQEQEGPDTEPEQLL